MPLPDKKPTEDRDEFIARCIEEVSSEFPDRKQATAVCYTRLKK
tara:strand:- start:842 stop:973 length:132 start_codon:yes stop_codon:yes gene_type:complete